MSDTKKMILAGVAVIVLVLGMYIGSKNNYITFPEAVKNATEKADQQNKNIIVMEDNTYSPANLIVKNGQTVTWENKGTMDHTATADDGSFDTRTIVPGQKVVLEFNTPGTYSYHCSFHPDMVGTIVVE